MDHWDADNPHMHLVVRGKDQAGENLVIGREYIAAACAFALVNWPRVGSVRIWSATSKRACSARSVSLASLDSIARCETSLIPPE